MTSGGHFKDSVLAGLARTANVAQFVSFGPGDPSTRIVCLHGIDASTSLRLDEAVEALLQRSTAGLVNVRSFDPDQPKSHDFVYGLATKSEVAGEVQRLTGAGLHVIVNETIDVSDGGVSGVAYAGVLEFAPDDTPRCVEKPGTASLPREIGLEMLEIVYGFRPDLPYRAEERVEFSIHPLRRGVRHSHTIVWEKEEAERLSLEPDIVWPNRFSRFLGDKAFGLLLAHALGLPVPAVTVISRRVAPFAFGLPTGSAEAWIRTCPVEQVAGRFTTARGWIDPFTLLRDEDPDGTEIASVLSQEGVQARYAGAAVAMADGDVLIEGVCGTGDAFMVGLAPPAPLPRKVVKAVKALHKQASARLGAVRMEWAFDGDTAWIMQLHRGSVASIGQVVFPGQATKEHRFRVEDGIEALRSLVASVEGTGEGVVLVGHVGITSHLGDILRKARIPSRIEHPPSPESHSLFEAVA